MSVFDMTMMSVNPAEK